MTNLDYLLIIPLILFTIRGFRNGIVHEFLSIAGFILAFFVSYYYMGPLSDSFTILFKSNSPYLPIFTGTVLFIGVLIATHLISRTLWGLFKILHLNFINRFIGSLFGLVKGSILVSAILLFLANLDQPPSMTRSASLLYPYLIDVAPYTYDLIASIIPGIEEFRATLEQTMENQAFIEKYFKK